MKSYFLLIITMPMDSICCMRTETRITEQNNKQWKEKLDKMISILKSSKNTITSETIIRLTKEVDAQFVDLLN